MKKYSTWIWVGLALLALFIRLVLSPAQIEAWYSRGFYKIVRWFLDHTVGIMPFPVVTVVVVMLILTIIWRTIDLIRLKATWKEKLKRVGFSTLSFVSGTVFLFLVLWGFNYGRIPLEEQLKLDLQPLSLEDVQADMEASAKLLAKIRKEIPGVTDSVLTANYIPFDVEEQQRAQLESLLLELGFPDVGDVRARLLRPKGILLRFSSSGVYFPWTGEGNVDAGLLALQVPFVLTHELAHGYGFGDEGTCNFLAYLACLQSENPVIQYSGQMGYFRYLASHYLLYKPEEYTAFRAQLPIGIQADLNAINANLLEYPDIMPEVRDQAYNTYLKAQGIEEGMKNYDRILMLVRAWREREKE